MSITNTAMQASFVIQRYPVEVYGSWFRIFVTCILPVAFINYYPAAAGHRYFCMEKGHQAV